MSWYRPKSNTNPANIQEEVVTYMPTSPTPALPPSIGSPRSHPQTIVPMRFGPSVSVLGSPEAEKTRNSSSKRAPKQPSAHTGAPRAEESTFSREGPPITMESRLGESSASIREATDAVSLDPTFPTLPAEEHPSNIAETSEYIPSAPIEATIIPGQEADGPKPDPEPLFSASMPAPNQHPSLPGIPRQRSPSPPLQTYSTPEELISSAELKASLGTVIDADTTMTVRSADSTPRIHAMTTLHDNMSHISIDGSVEDVLADTVQDSLLFENTILSSDSVYARQRRSLLDILNRLHSTGVQKDIDLPQIVVIGSQSVGKSSLIESMSGITLPRDTGTCTRCPMECRLEYSTDQWSCRVFLRFERDALGNSLENIVEHDFGPLITDRAAVEAVLRRAQRAILRPTLDHKLFLRDKDLNYREPAPLSFSSNCVCVRIRGPDVPDLYFYDLPGVIANVREGGDIRDIELVRNLVQTYISRPSCLVLLVVSCETDFENQGAGRLALETDPEGLRIVGVLTKPDRIESATGEKWAAVLRNEENRLLNGWFCVKQPDPTELKQKLPWEDARTREDLFFVQQEPWKSMSDHHKRRLGSTNLIRYLSRLLSKLVLIRLPEVEKELTLNLEDVTRRLKQLPAPRYDDPSSELVSIIFEFTAAVSRNIQGITLVEDSAPTLMQGIRVAQIQLRSSILRSAPRFCPWARQDTPPGSPDSSLSSALSNGTPPEWVSEPLFLSSEEQVPFQERIGKVIYLDEVMERVEQSITRELPGDYPTFPLKEELIKMSLRAWGKPMLNYFEAIHNLMNQHMKNVVDAHFGKHMHSGLHARAMAIVREQLHLLHDMTLQRLNSLLSVEGLPFTLNHMYLKEYKAKFLAHYRDIRRRSKGQDAIVHRFQELNKVVATDRQNLELMNLTGILQRFGLTCSPNDLHRLLPEDELEPALDIIATVRAYFQVAFKRFIDLVPLEVDSEFVRGFDGSIRNALVVGLDVKSPERCAAWLQDSPEVVGRRKELMATKQRLEAARAELSSFVLT